MSLSSCIACSQTIFLWIYVLEWNKKNVSTHTRTRRIIYSQQMQRLGLKFFRKKLTLLIKSSYKDTSHMEERKIERNKIWKSVRWRDKKTVAPVTSVTCFFILFLVFSFYSLFHREHGETSGAWWKLHENTRAGREGEKKEKKGESENTCDVTGTFGDRKEREREKMQLQSTERKWTR